MRLKEYKADDYRYRTDNIHMDVILGAIFASQVMFYYCYGCATKGSLGLTRYWGPYCPVLLSGDAWHLQPQVPCARLSHIGSNRKCEVRGSPISHRG